MTARFKYFFWHLIISLIICSSILIFFILTSYSWPLSKSVGFWHIALILLVVDVVIGPLLSLMVYKIGKKSLKFDLSCIIIIQLAALLFGIYSIYDARPAWIVYSVDRFELIKNTDIYVSNFNNIKENYTKPSALGPQIVAVQLSKSKEQYQQDLSNAVFAGLTLSRQPERYVDYRLEQPEVVKSMLQLSMLKKYNSARLADGILNQYPNAHGYIPLKASHIDMSVLIDKNGEVVKIVDLRPWK